MSNIPKLTVEKSLHVGDWDPTHKPPQPPPDIPGLTTINGPCWHGAGENSDHGWVKIIERHDKSVIGIIPPTSPRYDTSGSSPAQRSAWPNTGEFFGPLADAITISKQGDPGPGSEKRYDGVGVRVNANAHKLEAGEYIQIICDKLIDIEAKENINIKADKKITSSGEKFDIDNTNLTVNGVSKFNEDATFNKNVKINKILNLSGVGNVARYVTTTRSIANSKKSFDIPHPKKEDYRLRYVCLEGPFAEVYVRGKLKDCNYIEIPSHWDGLVDVETIGVSLSPIGSYQELYVEKIEKFKIIIKNNLDNPINCYYTITAERVDTPRNIPEYKGLTPMDYPGDNSSYNVNGL